MMRASTVGLSLTTLIGLIALAPACDQFEGNFDEDSEFNAGGIDPVNFPPAYRGAAQVRQTAASGTFTEIGAFANGTPIGYFQFPFSPSQIQTTNYAAPAPAQWPEGQIDPLRVAGPGTDFRQSAQNPVPVPSVYNFDPVANSNDPFALQAACRAPANYVQDIRNEAFPANQQWNIFTFPPDRFTSFAFGALPTWSYRPVVAEVPVQTVNSDCQSVKSERTLLANTPSGYNTPLGEPESDAKVGRLGRPNGRYLAWAMIDPGSGVFRVGSRSDVFAGGTISGTSVQKYGWYAQFIVAYIDGGYIPTEDGPLVAGARTTRMRTQRLYYPRSAVYDPADRRLAAGASPAAIATPGVFGAGYDVLQGDRFGNTEAYSPVCELWTYSLPTATALTDLPRDEETILQLANSTLEPARNPTQTAAQYTPNTAIIPRYVFCLQAAVREGLQQ